MVSTKRANQPFLSYKNYRDEQAKLHAAWREREDARLAAIAARRPEPAARRAGPDRAERDRAAGPAQVPGAPVRRRAARGEVRHGRVRDGASRWRRCAGCGRRSSACSRRACWRGSTGLSRGSPFTSRSTGTFLMSRAIPRVYGRGGSYALMAGVDAARAFGTGCFKDHRTHDLRGLSESELKGVEHWKKFFNEHKSYAKVGRVNHPPIDPASPLPVHCDPKKEVEQKARWGVGPPPSSSSSSSQEKQKKAGTGVREAETGQETTGGGGAGPATHHEEL
ncbi:hypothetical protein EDB83DRAFT_1852909 [Lactarius deliciosus]|nr:hypothetical protein EDB83DRAFT_1852909 [Lactarius deliciosus]